MPRGRLGSAEWVRGFPPLRQRTSQGWGTQFVICGFCSFVPVRLAYVPRFIIRLEPGAQLSTESRREGSMPTDVVMPQMGESIVEGTITKWLKKAGDRGEKDEPLFEISTDKVDAEIPSPVAGILSEIKVAEGATVGINTVVAVIGGAAVQSEASASAAKSASPQVSQVAGGTDVVMPQ